VPPPRAGGQPQSGDAALIRDGSVRPARTPSTIPATAQAGGDWTSGGHRSDLRRGRAAWTDASAHDLNGMIVWSNNERPTQRSTNARRFGPSEREPDMSGHSCPRCSGNQSLPVRGHRSGSLIRPTSPDFAGIRGTSTNAAPWASSGLGRCNWCRLATWRRRPTKLTCFGGPSISPWGVGGTPRRRADRCPTPMRDW
jgi:hypothetical protein